MTTDKIGIFLATGSEAGFLTGFEADPNELYGLSTLLTALEKLLKAEKEISGSENLFYTTPSIMERDEGEEEGDYHDISPAELASKALPFLDFTLEKTPELLIGSIVDAYRENYGGDLAHEFKGLVLEEFLSALADAGEKESANELIAKGTLVFLESQLTTLHGSKPVAFDPSHHDARKVLPASVVPDKPAGKLEIHPTAPDRVKNDGEFWGHFTDIPAATVFFRGATSKEIKKKAAIYEAWKTLFPVR